MNHGYSLSFQFQANKWNSNQSITRTCNTIKITIKLNMASLICLIYQHIGKWKTKLAVNQFPRNYSFLATSSINCTVVGHATRLDREFVECLMDGKVLENCNLITLDRFSSFLATPRSGQSPFIRSSALNCSLDSQGLLDLWKFRLQKKIQNGNCWLRGNCARQSRISNIWTNISRSTLY